MSHPVICKSGLSGWRDKLHNVYANLDEFSDYCRYYNIHKRLGYLSVRACWKDNPTVKGSVLPSDLERVKE